MKDKDAKILISSVKNTSAKLERYGDADIQNISMLKMIYKYSEYCTTQNDLKSLDKKVSYLQRSDRDICMETFYNSGRALKSANSTVDIINSENNPPTLGDLGIVVSSQGYYITIGKLLENYSDPENTSASLIEIKTVPANGTLYFNGYTVSAGLTINVSNTSDYLTFVRNSDSAYVTSFTYSAFDGDAQLPLESNTATLTLTCSEIVAENQPPTVGDTSLYIDNRETMVFTIADFTSNADPQYFDPEGDSLDAIRIDRISNTNQGQYLYYGTPVVVNQIITAVEISAGAFVYVSADINSIQTDVIEVSIRDDVNMQWVQ